jgi:hypothetical protein
LLLRPPRVSYWYMHAETEKNNCQWRKSLCLPVQDCALILNRGTLLPQLHDAVTRGFLRQVTFGICALHADGTVEPNGDCVFDFELNYEDEGRTELVVPPAAAEHERMRAPKKFTLSKSFLQDSVRHLLGRIIECCDALKHCHDKNIEKYELFITMQYVYFVCVCVCVCVCV